jgi:hypothetical protein
LYELFQTYCRSVPKISNRLPYKRTGQIYTRVQFQTYSLPCFNELYSLFYLDGKKIVPLNIFDLMTPLSLAYWIADDGFFLLTPLTTKVFNFLFLRIEINYSS